jgi:hypothetical protein
MGERETAAPAVSLSPIRPFPKSPILDYSGSALPSITTPRVSG